MANVRPRFYAGVAWFGQRIAESLEDLSILPPELIIQDFYDKPGKKSSLRRV